MSAQNRTVLLVAAALSSTSALAQKAGPTTQPSGHGTATTRPTESAAPSCSYKETALVQQDGIGADSLSYFISAEGDYIYYIGASHNRLTKAGSAKHINIPGGIDPVPTPDGKFMTLPGIDWYDATAMKRALEEGKDMASMPALSSNSGIGGVYQAIGQLKRADGRNAYRVTTDENGTSFQDFVVDQAGVPRPVAARPVRPCSDKTDAEMQLPMLSKDGKYISVYDSSSRSTKIYRLKDDNGGCELAVDLGVPTGKVDFDFTGDRIAFHMDFFKHDSGYFSGVSDSQTRDVFVANLKKDANGNVSGIKDFARMSTSHKKGYGTYYPRWVQDGRLFAGRQEGKVFSLATFDPKKAPYVPWWSPNTERADAKADDATMKRYALGALWNNVCAAPAGFRQGTSTEASFFALSLDKEDCKKLVNQQWRAHREEVAQEISRVRGIKLEDVSRITEADLIAACPDNAGPHTVKKVGQLIAPGNAPDKIFMAACRECHRGDYIDPEYNRRAPKLTFDDLNNDLDQVLLSIRAIEAEKTKRIAMPPANAGQMRDEQKEAFLTYLKGRAQELQQQEGDRNVFRPTTAPSNGY